MRHPKTVGLAAIAAAAFIAFLVAGTASATVLCKTNVSSGCGSAWDIASGKTLSFSAEGSTSLTGPFGELVATCTGSTMGGPTTSTGSSTATVTVGVSTFHYSVCNHAITVSLTTGTLEYHHIAGTKRARVTSNDSTFTIHGTIFGTCNFLTSNTEIGTLTGTSETGGAPRLDLTGAIPSENCGFSATWEGSYKYMGTENFNVAAS